MINSDSPKMRDIKRINAGSLSFAELTNIKKEITSNRQPVVIQGLDLGPCTKLWQPDYLEQTLKDKTVRVHVGQQHNLDFRTKNFNYCDMSLKELVRRAASSTNKQHFLDENEIYYLRNKKFN